MTEVRTQQGRDVDHLLIGALVAGLPHSAAAERAGVSESTVLRRLADAEFQMRLIEAKNDVLDRLLGLSANAAMAATNYLLRVVIGDEPDTNAGHRIRAAIALRSGLDRLDAHITGAR